MNRLYFAILLALIPILSFTFQYYFSKRENLLKSFKRHFTCYYFDWIFVPFNFCIAFILNLNAILLYCFLISFIFTIVSHIFWLRKNSNGYMFNFEKKRISFAGVAHLIFMTVEAAFVLFLFFSSLNIFSYSAFLFLVIFSMSGLYGSKITHGKIDLSDLVFIGVLLILILLKVIVG
jgi:hypothetical protein